MLPMECPRCRSTSNRTSSTNGLLPDQIVRRRVCGDCGHAWFTIELVVPDDAVGWSALHGNRPVLREPVLLHAAAVPPGAVGRPRSVTQCDGAAP